MQPAPAAVSLTAAAPDRHRWKVLAAGVAANASFSALFSGIPVTSVVLRADYQLSNAQLGLALGMLSLGVALGELPWGVLTDRLGDRKVLLTGLSGTIAALWLLVLRALPGQGAHVFVWLCAGLMLDGLLGGSVNGSSGRAIMAWFGEGERGLAMSIRQTAVPLGGGVGALVLPSLAAQAGFGAVYAALMVACLASVVLTWLWLREAPPGHVAQVATHGQPALRNRVVWRVALATGLLCSPQVALLSFGGIFLREMGHASLLLISGAMTVVQLGAAVCRVASGRWTDRRRNRRQFLRHCAVASAVLFALLALTGYTTPSLMAVLLCAAGIVVSAWHGVAYTELAVQAGPAQVGTALGLGNSCVFLVFFVTAQVVPVLLQWGGWTAVWLGVAAVALVVWPLFPRQQQV